MLNGSVALKTREYSMEDGGLNTELSRGGVWMCGLRRQGRREGEDRERTGRGQGEDRERMAPTHLLPTRLSPSPLEALWGPQILHLSQPVSLPSKPRSLHEIYHYTKLTILTILKYTLQ